MEAGRPQALLLSLKKTIMQTAITPVFDLPAIHGEGPVWDEQKGLLYWVDIPGERYFKGDLKTGLATSYPVGQAIGVLALREQGGIIMAVRDGFGFYDEAAQSLRLIEPSPEQHNDLVRFNDGAIDPAGRFLAGTMAWDETNPIGQLFSLTPDLQWKSLMNNLYISNGMGWSKDLKTFFFIDTLQHAVYAYDYALETGDITNQRTFISFPTNEYPDGMCVDNEDGIWVAMYGMGKVIHFDGSGQKVGEIQVPAPHTTSCCFGGDKMQTLFITTSKRDLSEAQQKEYPLAGRTFMVETDVVGKVEPRFKG